MADWLNCDNHTEGRGQTEESTTSLNILNKESLLRIDDRYQHCRYIVDTLAVLPAYAPKRIDSPY